MENWQSEYLQFTTFILGTIWLVQRGSPESKPVDQAGTGSDREQRVGQHAGPRSPLWARVGSVRTFVYSNSLLLVMGAGVPGRYLRQRGSPESKPVGAPHEETGT